MSCSPNTAIIFPDGLLGGERSVESVTSEAGAQAPEVIVGDDNCGTLVPMLRGAPSTGSDPFQMLIQRSGRRRDAGFIYRRGTSGDYIGGDDGRKLWKHQAPFTSGATPNAEGTSLAHCIEDDSLILACLNSAAISFRKRDANAADYDTWTSSSLTPSTIGAPQPGSGSLDRIATCYTANNVLLLAYTYQDATTGVNGIALIKSADCGTTWSLLHTDLVQGLNDIADPGGQIHLTVSGRWVRLDWLNLAEDNLNSRASSDDGLSWSDIVEVTDANFAVSASGPALDPAPYSVVGLGGGQFMLAYAANGSGGIFLRLATTTTANEWVVIFITGTTSRAMIDTIVGIAAYRAHDRVYAFVSTQDGVGQNTDDQVSLYYHRLEGITEQGPGQSGAAPIPSEWQPVEPLSGFVGCRYVPVLIRAVNIGRSIFLHWGSYDHESAVEIGGDKPAAELSGQTVRSLGSAGPGGSIAADDSLSYGLPKFFDIQWATPYGEPDGGASSSADTSWTRATAGAPTITWSADALSIVTGVGDTANYITTGTSSTTDSWSINGAEMCAVFKVNSGSSQTASLHGYQIVSETTPLGQQFSLTVRADTAGFRVYDDNAAADLATLTLDMTDWVEIRVTMRNAGVYVWAARLDDYLNPVESGPHTATSAAAGPNDSMQFGALTPGVGDSEWREVWVNEFTGTTTFSNPDDLLPLATTTEETLLQAGVQVRWGGGSAAIGDAFTTRNRATYPLRAALMDEDTIGWRSTGLSAQSLIFVADPDDDTVRFIHDAIMLTGIEDFDVLVDYDITAAFSAPFGTLSMTGLTHAALIVDSVDGNTIKFTAASVATAELYAGELAGQRVTFTISSTPYTYAVLRHPTADTIEVAEITATGPVGPDLAVSPVVPGGTSVASFLTYVHGQQGSQVEARYMRIRMTSTATATGDHRLAGVVAGVRVDVPFELDWTHTDDVQSGAQLVQGPWVDHAFQQGADPQVWVGRITNDYEQWRDSVRALGQTLAGFLVRPVGLIIDDADKRRSFRARWAPDPHENSFWWTEDSGTRHPGGDQTLRFTRVK